MIEKVKLALRIKSNAFDDEIQGLIDAALADLRLAGVTKADETDPLLSRAIITFCKANFGSPEEYDRLKLSYDEQKAQLMVATGYTDWGEEDG